MSARGVHRAGSSGPSVDAEMLLNGVSPRPIGAAAKQSLLAGAGGRLSIVRTPAPPGVPGCEPTRIRYVSSATALKRTSACRLSQASSAHARTLPLQPPAITASLVSTVVCPQVLTVTSPVMGEVQLNQTSCSMFACPKKLHD